MAAGSVKPMETNVAISLFDISVACYIQTLDAVGGFLEKGLGHCREHGIDPEEVVEARIFPDMLPFRFQVLQVIRHSVGAVEAIRSGLFQAGGERPQPDYAGLQAMIAEARATMGRYTPDEINAREGSDLVFRAGEIERHFTAEGFVLSFSLPNLHFHAATAYDILRGKGVPVGKRDYIGTPRLKG